MTVPGVVDAALELYVRPTWFLDSDAPSVAEFAAGVTGRASTPRERAVRLYYGVRDGVRYDPYTVTAERRAFKASTIANAPSGFCVQKAILLAAAGRAVGVPTRLGFADVRNHLASEKLLEMMGTDLFVFHGYTEFFLGDRWIKVTPTFNVELCTRFGVRPLDFDGTHDAIFHPFDEMERRHMEYVHDRGSFADLPYEEMIRVLKETYPALAAGSRGPADDPEFA
jgi:transglutaminase-like putative cysteine protease